MGGREDLAPTADFYTSFSWIFFGVWARKPRPYGHPTIE